MYKLVILIITYVTIYLVLQLKQVTLNKVSISYYRKREDNMGLVYEIAFSGASNHVHKRVIEYSINGVTTEKTAPYSTTVLTLPTLQEGDVITARIKDVDLSGNESEWSDLLTFTAKDTIPPPKPGVPGVKLVAETDDEPVVVPPPAPEPAVAIETPVNIVLGDTVVSPAHDD